MDDNMKSDILEDNYRHLGPKAHMQFHCVGCSNRSQVDAGYSSGFSITFNDAGALRDSVDM